ncbi:bystin [Lycium barbarum]|uniref:bystin n=1 Tax=Lycium barbarum TaxID=112863 RepID=UPI00293E3573|nr:bystin [Lycium barbarum]
MGKKRERLTNPEPFLEDDTNSKASSKKRSKAPKSHQQQQQVISSSISSKILKEALLQQKEVDEEETRERNPNAPVFDEEVATKAVEEDDDDDIDNFGGFQETQSQFGGDLEDEVDKLLLEDEMLLESFLSKHERPERTLANIIEKMKEQNPQVSSGVQPTPKLDDSIIELYKGVGKHLNKYTSGKMPKAFKHIPSLQYWEDVLYLTEPEKWSPNAMYQATRIFASNLGVKKAERFYKFVLLPRVRDDIRKNKRLHFALYQSLKKSLYKPAAFNKGILFPLCESKTCTLREAVIFGSVIEKVSIPHLHASVALLKLAEMEYCGTTSYFIKLLIEKKYALPYRVLDAMVAHFMSFFDESRVMPVIWHLSLLVFVQRYKTELRKEDKANIRALVERQRHRLITPDILREIEKSRSRGEKEDDAMSIASPLSVINKAIEEDRFDIPDVPMEED